MNCNLYYEQVDRTYESKIYDLISTRSLSAGLDSAGVRGFLYVQFDCACC
jgi:hypothetical protein